MNELDDSIAARIARIFRLDSAWNVHEDPPESVDDLPAVIVAEINGDMSSGAYAGLKDTNVTVRLLVLVALRGREGLSKAFSATRPYVNRVLGLLWTHDELSAEGETGIAEIKTIRWKEGKVTYGGVDFSGIEVNVDLRVDWQMYFGSGPVGTLPA